MTQIHPKTASTRKEREKLHRRADIIKAARVVFARRGFNEATLDEIALTAEYGKATLYNYFESKEELFDAVIDDGMEYLHSLAVEACSDGAQPLEKCYLRFADLMQQCLYANNEIIPLIMRELHKVPMRPQIAQLLPAIVDTLSKPVEKAVKEKVIPKVQPERMAMLFFTMIVSLYKSTLIPSDWADMCRPGPVVIYDTHELRRVIDSNLAILRMTFFHGLLNRPTSA